MRRLATCSTTRFRSETTQRYLPLYGRITAILRLLDRSSLTASRLPNVQVTPPDPWKYLGPKGLYILSNYQEPKIKLSWFAAFIVTCMGDLVESIARQGFQPNDPYPDGDYACDLDYSFPTRLAVRFELRLEKAVATDWYMTFADISDDLEALYFASLWFEDQAASMPSMDVEIHRYRSGHTGPPFLASKGGFSFRVAVDASFIDTGPVSNVSNLYDQV